MNKRQIFVTRLFQLVFERQFLGAERILERLRNNLDETDWNSGYLKALEGLILVKRTKDEYAFLTKDDFDLKELVEHRKELLKEANNKLHTDFDRGYFSALAEYLGFLKRIRETKSGKSDKK